MTTFADRILHLRRDLGRRNGSKHAMTQGEFARKLGVSKTTVSNWERGTSEPRGGARRLLEQTLRELEI